MSADPFSSLRTFDTSSLASVFDSPSDQARSGGAILPSPRALGRRVARRAFVDGRKIARCVDAIERLPEPDEVLTIVQGACWDNWSYVPTVATLAGAQIEHLRIGTLGFNSAGIESLRSMLDDGRVNRCTFLASCYFRSVDSSLWTALHSMLTKRGQRVVAARSHAKLLLFQMANGATYTIESSGNLRSCKNIEATSIAADPTLHDFHSTWLDSVVDAAIAEGVK